MSSQDEIYTSGAPSAPEESPIPTEPGVYEVRSADGARVIASLEHQAVGLRWLSTGRAGAVPPKDFASYWADRQPSFQRLVPAEAPCQPTGRPWEILGRVPVQALYRDGEPAGAGEILVRRANYVAMPVPEAFDGEPEISLAIATPVTDDGRERETLAGAMLTEECAAQLAEALAATAIAGTDQPIDQARAVVRQRVDVERSMGDDRQDIGNPWRPAIFAELDAEDDS